MPKIGEIPLLLDSILSSENPEIIQSLHKILYGGYNDDIDVLKKRILNWNGCPDQDSFFKWGRLYISGWHSKHVASLCTLLRVPKTGARKAKVDRALQMLCSPDEGLISLYYKRRIKKVDRDPKELDFADIGSIEFDLDPRFCEIFNIPSPASSSEAGEAAYEEAPSPTGSSEAGEASSEKVADVEPAAAYEEAPSSEETAVVEPAAGSEVVTKEEPAADPLKRGSEDAKAVASPDTKEGILENDMRKPPGERGAALPEPDASVSSTGVAAATEHHSIGEEPKERVLLEKEVDAKRVPAASTRGFIPFKRDVTTNNVQRVSIAILLSVDKVSDVTFGELFRKVEEFFGCGLEEHKDAVKEAIVKTAQVHKNLLVETDDNN